jgi:hypothetical protein
MKTTFVLGAGASRDYQFPTAMELRTKILSLKPDDLLGEPITDDNYRTSTFASEWSRFVHAYRGAGGSIDYFIEARPEFDTVGRLAIAKILSDCERRALREAAFSNESYWYAFVFDRLFRKGLVPKHRLSVVTFNYDRSFELAMLSMHWNKYGQAVSIETLQENVPIVHVYGSLLDDFIWPMTQMLPDLVNDATPHQVLKFARGIELMTAEREAERKSEFERAREEILTANEVVFLGFGWDLVNVTRLGIGPGALKLFADGKRPEKWITHRLLGTSLGLGDAELQRTLTALGFQHVPDRQPRNCLLNRTNGVINYAQFDELTCLPFLKKYALFVSGEAI